MFGNFIALPISLRMAIVAVMALAAARFINWAICNWAYFHRQYGPWAAPPEGYPPRTARDRIPVLGWLALRREAPAVGRLFWLRPLLIELVFPVAMMWYYHFYVTGGALPLGQAAKLAVGDLHWQFLGHAILFVLMMIATFIDFDEQSIPDYVTIPGTLIGLLGAAMAPAWLPFHQAPVVVEELHANIPAPWPTFLDGLWGLAIGLTIVAVWGFALLDRRWIGRRGVSKGVRYFFARMFRHRWLWKIVLLVTLLLAVGVAAAWGSARMNPGRWTYLLSSLLGLAFAGGVTWGVRLAASWGLQVEALGFGDVTLMAMIGTYVGWQPAMLIFFLAPLVSLAFVLVRWLITGDAATPYGPYLCASTVLLLIYWDRLWTHWAAGMFALGPAMIVGIVLSCIVLMGAMLWIWRLIKQALGIAGH